jgi:hypothetical protein
MTKDSKYLLMGIKEYGLLRRVHYSHHRIAGAALEIVTVAEDLRRCWFATLGLDGCELKVYLKKELNGEPVQCFSEETWNWGDHYQEEPWPRRSRAS